MNRKFQKSGEIHSLGRKEEDHKCKENKDPV